MSDTEEKAKTQKPKTSKLALLSPVLAVLGFCMALLFAIHKSGRLYLSILSICWLSELIGLILGIVALVKIGNSKGRISGQVSATLGIGMAAILLMLLCLFMQPVKRLPPSIACGSNLHRLGIAMRLYADVFDGKYPTANVWCDLLAKDYGGEYLVRAETFVCKSALRKGDDGRCHYAVNPDCEPNSPPDIVLLFETKGGWNQFGWLEILTTENHNGKGCNVLFNDIHVEFIKTEQLDKLKWKVDEEKTQKAELVSSKE
jgi:hypothetical protein